MVGKVQSKRLSNELSIMIRIKHQDFGIPVMTLANQYRKFSIIVPFIVIVREKPKSLRVRKAKLQRGVGVKRLQLGTKELPFVQ